jgi:AbrB family looped-hinge helix DNA binding protein
MDTSTLTQKGQVTIPAGVRRKLGLRTGDRVSFVQEGDHVIVKPVHSDIKSAFGLVRARRSASLKDYEAAIRKRAGR